MVLAQAQERIFGSKLDKQRLASALDSVVREFTVSSPEHFWLTSLVDVRVTSLSPRAVCVTFRCEDLGWEKRET